MALPTQSKSKKALEKAFAGLRFFYNPKGFQMSW
jgi:hypothetical protein